MPMRSTNTWDLPAGVAPGTWDYTQADHIATDYDRYFADAGMFRADADVIQRWCGVPGDVVDLGTGTGRAIIPLAARGYRCLAVDLSQPMLDQVSAKRLSEGIPPERLPCVRANLVDLDCLPTAHFDYALCLFSTLGMVQGDHLRQQALRHFARILRWDGILVLQVHNYWVQLFDPEGPAVMLRNAWRRWIHRSEQIGDKVFPYRGIPNMYLHTFRARELRQLLTAAGFRMCELLPLNRDQSGPLPWRAWLPQLRATGWIVVASKSVNTAENKEKPLRRGAGKGT